MKFPDDFIHKTHPVVSSASQWTAKKPNGTTISIVGGGHGLYGNGVTTFEMWDFDTEQPEGYLSKEEINEYLQKI